MTYQNNQQNQYYKPFTVVAVNPANGNFVVEKIYALTAFSAFSVMSQMEEHQDVEFVVALLIDPAKQGGITFPGESVVGAETVREQPDVFPLPETRF